MRTSLDGTTLKLEKPLVGACGVFYVSAELARRGWVAMPTIRNTSGIDIIAIRGNRDVKIQVKTNSYGKIKYLMNKSNEELFGDNIFYVFATLKDQEERPDFYILPSKLVASYIKETYEKFRTEKPMRIRRGETLKDTKERRKTSLMRQFPNRHGKMLPAFKNFEIDEYKDKWDILE